MTRQPDASDFRHGASAYIHHRCRCEICRTARREYMQEYAQRPKYRAWQQRTKAKRAAYMKEYVREYRQRPEVKAKQAAYLKQPEVKALRAAQRLRHKERVQAGLSSVPSHGLSGYSNHGCRCEVCREANRTAHLAYMASHPEQRLKSRERERFRRAA